MINNNISIILIIFIILLYILFNKKSKESFRLFYEYSPSTRNMSYDLRCEPIIPKNNCLFPNSSIEPHYRRKCLDLR